MISKRLFQICIGIRPSILPKGTALKPFQNNHYYVGYLWYKLLRGTSLATSLKIIFSETIPS